MEFEQEKRMMNIRQREFWLAHELPGKSKNISFISGSIILILSMIILYLLILLNNDKPEYATIEQLKKIEAHIFQLEERLVWQDEKIDSLQYSNDIEKSIQIPKQNIPVEISEPQENLASEKEIVSEHQDLSKGIVLRYHQVRTGETLYRISIKYGVSINDLRNLNKLDPDDSIHPGQRLLIGKHER